MEYNILECFCGCNFADSLGECPVCGRPVENIINSIEDGDYEAVWDDDDPPMGCKTCGNWDNYPACYEACPMNPD